MTRRITGKTLIEWGFEPGAWFGDAIDAANALRDKGRDDDFIKKRVEEMAPAPVAEIPLRTNSLPISMLIDAETLEERKNVGAVVAQMDAIMRVEPVRAAAIMPDACPAPGSLCVGGVVSSERIHPSFHSADVCCSMAISVFEREDDLSKFLDAGMDVSHFGSSRREKPVETPELRTLLSRFSDNKFLSGLEEKASRDFATQGDGNHFFYVGSLDGKPAIVTHHGSRGFGAELYKRGVSAARRHTSIVSPRTPEHCAWIREEEEDEYWDALQAAREWTKLNHFAIHDLVARKLGNSVETRFWNEHNFVFRKSDGLFYHGKGATPNWRGFSPDDSGLTLVPLNMSEPILLLDHVDNPASLGFAPHGAGRNLSRTAHKKSLAEEMGADSRGLSPNNVREIMERETKGIDVRFYTGKPDVSELPSAYKSAEAVTAQIEKYGIGRVVNSVSPYGTIMAGEGVNWRDFKKRKKARK